MIMNVPPIAPSPVLSRNLFFIKDAVKTLEAKTGDKFDIFDPHTRELLLECREPDLSGTTKLRRLAGGNYDLGAPFNLIASVPGSKRQLLRLARKVPFLSFKDQPIELYDHEDLLIATLRRKFFCIGRKFPFFTPRSTLLFELNAKSILNGYRLLVGKKELGTLWLRWKGDRAAYLEQRFKYALAISEDVPKEDISRQLLLGLALCFHRIKA
jgi:hypothetical protein